MLSLEKRWTNVLQLQNICLFCKGQEWDHGERILEYVDCVAITFEWQTKEKQMDTVSQMVPGNDLPCPISHWAAIVNRIQT